MTKKEAADYAAEYEPMDPDMEQPPYEREKRPAFHNKRTGRFQGCRLSDKRLTALFEDPMSDGAPLGEFVNQWRKQDLRDGCPYCSGEVADNASEPDVMARWDLR